MRPLGVLLLVTLPLLGQGSGPGPKPKQKTTNTAQKLPSFTELQPKAEMGDADAQYNIGLCYEKGRGVQKDIVEALKWYRKAADQGFPAAECELGSDYIYGELRVSKDTILGEKWLKSSSGHGYSNASYLLSLVYLEGRVVQKSESESLKWLKLAAMQGHAKAQGDLGDYYAFGILGVEEDPAEAYIWACLSEANGYREATKLRKALSKNWSQESIVPLRLRVRQLQAEIQARKGRY